MFNSLRLKEYLTMKPTRTFELFWGPACPKCFAAKKFGKEVLEQAGYAVEMFNILTVDGLTTFTYHELSTVPTLLLVNENDHIHRIWTGTMPSLEECVRAVQRSLLKENEQDHSNCKQWAECFTTKVCYRDSVILEEQFCFDCEEVKK